MGKRRTGKNTDSITKYAWIDELSSEELAQELSKFNLPEQRTRDDQIKTLITFLEEGVNSNPETTNSSRMVIREESCHSEINTRIENLEKIRKWGLHYDGKEDPFKFLEKLQELKEEYNIPDEHMLGGLLHCLRESALAWYRNSRDTWTSYREFLEDFTNFYFSGNFRDALEEEISRKIQKTHENGKDFLVSMQTLIRRHGGYTKERELACIYKRLRPEYREYIRPKDAKNIKELATLIDEYEKLQKELKTPVKNRICPNQIDGRENRLERRTQDIGRNIPPNNPTHNICWNCKQEGHYRQDCRNQRKLFCSVCLRDGIASTQCCRAMGNYQGNGPNRGQTNSQ